MNKKIRNILAILSATVLTLSIIQTFLISIASANVTLILSKYSGNVGEEILVSGTDASPGNLTEIYWDKVVKEKKLNQTYAKGDGTFSCYIKIPEDIVGSHWVIAASGSAEFIIEPEVVPKPNIGLPEDTINVNGTGFASRKKIIMAFGNKTETGEWNWSRILTTNPSIVETDANGSFSCTFKVPYVDYGNYIVNATDENRNVAEADFTVNAIVTLTPKEGPSGTIVTISGRGFTKAADRNVIIKIDGTIAKQIEPVKTRADGTLTGRFLVPTLDIGEYTVNVTDEAGITSTTNFKVTIKTRITLTPNAGAPNIEVTMEGTGFTAIIGTKITVKFRTLTVKTLYTNSTGGFKETFNAPQLPPDTYEVTAIDENTLNATELFKIAIRAISLEPNKGPTGTIVNVTGYGFTGTTANITFGTYLVRKNIAVSAVLGGTWFIVPTLPVEVYSVTVTDEEGLSALATFEVTETTTLILTPDITTHDASVSAEAGYFTQIAGTPLTFTIKNSTWEMTLTVNPTSPWTAVETDETGSFKGTFKVPYEDLKDKWITTGDYIIGAKDNNSLVAEALLSIILPSVHIGTRSSEYMPGDTISFYVNTTFTCSFKIEITDPLGFIKELTISDADWQTIRSWKVVPYENASFTLPNDAELGVWKWSATLILVEASGSFTVIKPTIEKLNEEIALLRDKVSSLEGKLSLLSEKLNEISSKVDALNEETLGSLRNDINNIQKELNALKNHVSEAEEAARNAQQTSSNLTTLTYIVLAVSIGAVIAAILAFIAIIELGRIVTEGLKL